MRPPGYEYLDTVGAGRPLEYNSRGGEQRQAVDIGRPRGAAARAAGRGPDAAAREMHADRQDELAKMKARLEQLQLP